VPARPDAREELRALAGDTEIPTLVTDDGDPICGEDDILAYLSRFEEQPDAAVHRAKAREEVPQFEEVAT
jgi:glutathione S-transferase